MVRWPLPGVRSNVRSMTLLAVTWAAACGGDADSGSPSMPNNEAPAASGAIPALRMAVGQRDTIRVASYFDDPDGDVLTYTAVSSDPSIATVAVTGTSMSITAVSEGTAMVTATARDPWGLSATLNGVLTVVGVGPVFRDDFRDAGSLAEWETTNASATVSGGSLRLTNTHRNDRGTAAHALGQSVTAWETRVRLGRAAASTVPALSFVPTDRGVLDFHLFRLEIGTQTLRFRDGEEIVNYAFSAYFQPEGRELGWYYFSGSHGESEAIDDAPGAFTEITARHRDGRFEVLAGNEALFSDSAEGTIYGVVLSEINAIGLESRDLAAANPGIFDWVEISGVATSAGG